jgi:hypothetical protein
MSENNKYNEMDNKFFKFIDDCMNQPGLMSPVDKHAYTIIKNAIIEYPNEIESFRGKYVAFQNGIFVGVYDTAMDMQNDTELHNAVLIFIPNEHKYCNVAQMPYRNAIVRENTKTWFTTIKDFFKGMFS